MHRRAQRAEAALERLREKYRNATSAIIWLGEVTRGLFGVSRVRLQSDYERTRWNDYVAFLRKESVREAKEQEESAMAAKEAKP